MEKKKTIAEQRDDEISEIWPYNHFFDDCMERRRQKGAVKTYELYDNRRSTSYDIYQYDDGSLLVAYCAGHDVDAGVDQETYKNLEHLKNKDSRLYNLLKKEIKAA